MLEELLKTEPDNADGWLLLFNALDDPQRKMDALKQAQRIRPGDEGIRQKIHKYKASASYRSVKAGQYVAKKEAAATEKTARKRQEEAEARRSFFRQLGAGARNLFAQVRAFFRDRF